MKSGCEKKEVKQKRSISLPVVARPPDDVTVVAHSKTSFWRAAALITLTVLMAAHFIQWRLTGSTVSPIEPSETMYTLQSGAVNAGFIFFLLAILGTVLFGRFVCGWGCHILALQDLCAWMLKKMGLTPRPFRSRLLVFVPLAAALYMFVWPTVSRLFAAPKGSSVIPQFTNHLITTEFWATFPPLAVAIPFLFICGFMTVYFLGSKGFCTYACPYGGFFSLADKISPGKIRVTDACNECGHCTAVCTSNVIVHAEVKQYGMVVDPGCMKCMDCVSVCPNDALYFGFGKPAIGVKTTIKKNYSLTWPEEAAAAFIFFASYMAVWDVYQLVPMLMALGTAAITAFVALRVWKLFRSSDLSFYRSNLKANGSIRPAGWIFLVCSFLWLTLIAHSGIVHYQEWAGSIAFQNIRIPDELALARANPTSWLTPPERKNIADGKRHLQNAQALGLFRNVDTASKLAWFEYLSGDTEGAIRSLGENKERQQGRAKALSLYYRGAMLNRIGRYDDAMADLEKAADAAPDLVVADEEIGESLWQLGRKQEAVSVWTDAAAKNPGLVVANAMLAGAAKLDGRDGDSAEFEVRADKYTPTDALFLWMVGQRLQNVGMNAVSERYFDQAIAIDPQLRARRNLDLMNSLPDKPAQPQRR